MKKVIPLLFLALLLFAAPLTVSEYEYKDFYGKKSALTGSTGDYVSRVIVNAEPVFYSFIPYVLSGKAEYGAQSISITDERKKSVMFTDVR